MRKLISLGMICIVSLLSGVPSGFGQPEPDDPLVRCHDISRLARKACQLQLENALLNVAGAAALTCIGAFFIGNLAAAILCLVAFGVGALLAINLYETYQNCIEQADLQEEICIETYCT